MKVFLFLILAIFTYFSDLPYANANAPLTSKESLANEVTNQAFAQLKKEKELHPFGTGSEMLGQIKMLALCFHYYKEIDIEQARELLMSANAKFLYIINNNEKIRPYLENYPFKTDNIEIIVYLKKPDGSKVGPDKLCVITLIDGELKYKIDQPKTDKLLTIHKETYLEAAQKSRELDSSEVFTLNKDHSRPLHGKIIQGRYHSPKSVFSCRAYDYNQGEYISQDTMDDQFAAVAFYSLKGDFKQAEMMFIPEMEKRKTEKKELREIFDDFGIDILKIIDKAQGIEILKEEMIGERTLFIAVSIEKMFVLKDSNGKHMPSTRGYLVFIGKDKIILLSNQVTTPSGEKHNPLSHIERLKNEILEFRNSLEFDL